MSPQGRAGQMSPRHNKPALYKAAWAAKNSRVVLNFTLIDTPDATCPRGLSTWIPDAMLYLDYDTQLE